MIGVGIRWLHWRVPFYLFSKFGLPYDGLLIGIAALYSKLQVLHLSSVGSLQLAFKIPFIIAALIVSWEFRYLSKAGLLPRGRRAGVLWLLSPATIFVAAVHGQVEPLAIATLLAAVILCFQRKWFVAGIFAALGTSIDYVPLLVTLVPILALLCNEIRMRTFLRYCLGLFSGLGLFYGPLLFSTIGRSAIISGAGATEAGGAGIVKETSIWYLLWHLIPQTSYQIWPLLLLFVLAALLAKAVRARVERWETRALMIIALSLIAFTIIYPSTLPQFNLLALAGLLILLSMGRISIWLATMPPLTAYLGFLFSSSLYQFFWNTDHNIVAQLSAHSLLPVLPNNWFLFHLFSTITILLYAATLLLSFCSNWNDLSEKVASRAHLASPVASGLFAVFLLYGLIVLAMLAIAVQPAFDAGVFTKRSTTLAEYSSWVDPIWLPAQTDPSGIHPVVQSAISLAAGASRVKPRIGIAVQTAPAEVDLRAVTTKKLSGTISLPDWRSLGTSHDQLDVRLLVMPMTQQLQYQPSQGPVVEFNGTSIEPIRTVAANLPWRVSDYLISGNHISSDGRLNISLKRQHSGWVLDGGAGGRLYSQVVATRTYFDVQVDGHLERCIFEGNSTGYGLIENVWHFRTSNNYQDAHIQSGLVPIQRYIGTQMIWGRYQVPDLGDMAAPSNLSPEGLPLPVRIK